MKLIFSSSITVFTLLSFFSAQVSSSPAANDGSGIAHQANARMIKRVSSSATSSSASTVNATLTSTATSNATATSSANSTSIVNATSTATSSAVTATSSVANATSSNVTSSIVNATSIPVLSSTQTSLVSATSSSGSSASAKPSGAVSLPDLSCCFLGSRDSWKLSSSNASSSFSLCLSSLAMDMESLLPMELASLKQMDLVTRFACSKNSSVSAMLQVSHCQQEDKLKDMVAH